MPFRHRLLAAIIILASPLVVGGCDRGPSGDGTDAPRGETRIVVLAPAAAEMVDALGAADLVVAVGDYVRWPPGFAGLPRVGGYDSPNVETVLEHEATLLVTAAGVAGATSFERLESLGVEVLPLDTSTYDGVFASLRTLGSRLGLRDRATELERTMRARLESVRERAEGAAPRKVLFVVGRDPLYVAGPGSHVDELIGLAGGVNVAVDAMSPYQMVSLEAMIERMPDVIVDTSDNRPGSLRGRTPGPWGKWGFLPAVENDRVYWVEPDRLVIPGIRLPEMAELMGRLIHPERFGEAEDVHFGPLVAGPESPISD
jgi:iron complex transport system substrate-binding protein